ncbi:MAG: DNA mismatch repair protein [Candidatus Kerfeldbacteria bacterium]|nr:DNA mismatch repair protein [Candidatus Kerfeldbacteria bacterium]
MNPQIQYGTIGAMQSPIVQEIDSLLAQNEPSLIESYFRIQRLCEAEFGEHTVVIMEIGSFFEVYGIDNHKEKIGKSKEIADILNVQLTRKNKSVLENSVQNPLLAGFPTAAFDRYISRIIQEKKYTIVIIRQRGIPPKITRYLDCVLSPGVNIDYLLDHDDNFVSSVTIDQHHGVYAIGVATMDVASGKTTVLEMYSTEEDPTYALDELFSVLQTYRTSEYVFTALSSEVKMPEVLHYLELSAHANIKLNTKRLSVAYQNELLKQVYEAKSMLSPIEYLNLERMPLSSEALVLLLEFVIEHDYGIIQALNPPHILDTKKFLYLGNNPLEQLTIISKDPQEFTVLELIDYTSTSIGRRLLRDRLLHPITHAAELEERFDLVEQLRPVEKEISAQLNTIYDLERLLRRMQLGRLHPFEIQFLHDSLSAIVKMIELEALSTAATVSDVVHLLNEEQSMIQNLLTRIEQVFYLPETAKATAATIDCSFFQPGYDRMLDTLITEQKAHEAKLEILRAKVVVLLQEKTAKEDVDYVQVKQLDKEGHYLTLTKSRYLLIQDELKASMVSIDGTVYAFSDFNFKLQTTTVKITGKIIDDISEQIVVLQTKIAALVKELYAQELATITREWSALLQRLVSHVAKIDVAVSTVKSARALNFVRPEMVNFSGETVLEVLQLRHPLIEAREEQGIYVPNDVTLGNRNLMRQKNTVFTKMTESDIRGVLLYGINSSGKSSLMKSIGICIILAQAGFFVPAKAMRFTLFTELFTRIIARDQVEKGLSSFAVEMMELKNIFNRASKRSMILGDEISHGTETLSAIAIVSATIQRLSEIHALFLFATHLHQLQELDVVKQLPHVVSAHLGVQYDETRDTIIFERTLQAGSGSAVYGLEFAKSLHMDKQFLKYAWTIRKTLANEYSETELLTKQQRSPYHPELLLTSCAVCRQAVEDTHHIRPQHTANTEGYIDHIPKDHKFNLVPLCKACHKKIHAGKLTIHGFVMTTNGLQLQYTEEE